MEYYSTLTRKEILTHAVTWFNLKDIMLSETSQGQRDKSVWFCLYEIYSVFKFIEKERIVVAGRKENGESVFDGNRVSVWQK